MSNENLEEARPFRHRCSRERWITAVVALGLAVNLAFGFQARSEADVEDGEDSAYKSISLLMNVVQIIRRNYVDADKVSYEKLVHGALKGMLNELDPFSSYEPPEDYQRMREQTEGHFGGIGVVVTIRDNNMLEVVAPMEDTPGFAAGILAGDVITEVDGTPTRGLAINECVNMLKGPPGTKVKLTIFRQSDDTTKTIEVERAVIQTSGVKSGGLIQDGIGYIRLSQFVGTTTQKMEEELEKFRSAGARGLIIDLRGNPGGILVAAIEVSSLFIEAEKLIVFTEGRQESQRHEFLSRGGRKFLDFHIILLIDGNTASAAEILAGCLQDYGRAVLVGERSFGKGSVQTVIPLSDDGAVRFTTAKYYTPKEQVIHEHGVKPDVEVVVSGPDAAKLARQRASYPGVVRPDIAGSIDDSALKRALEVLRGVILLGDRNNGN